VDLTKYIEEHHFNFDMAFDEKATNEDVNKIMHNLKKQIIFLGLFLKNKYFRNFDNFFSEDYTFSYLIYLNRTLF